MLNQERLNSLLEAYIRDFDLWWQQEEYKLLSLQSFQAHWNLNCPDFVAMLEQATRNLRHINLFSCKSEYQDSQFIALAKMATHTTQKAVAHLLDEQAPLSKRVDSFTEAVNRLLAQFANDNPNWSLFTKQSQSISTLLFLHNPSHYYVYQREALEPLSNYIEAQLPINWSDNLTGTDLETVFNFYAQLNEHLCACPKLKAKAQHLYARYQLPNDQLHLLTWDLAHYYTQGAEKAQ